MACPGRPQRHEADAYYFRYMDLIPGDEPVGAMRAQAEEVAALAATVGEEQSQRSYAPAKWTLRQVLSHINDTERVFAFRALWFARGFEAALPGFDQDVAAASAGADAVTWRAHLEEFHHVRLASIALFSHLSAAAWDRSGTASGTRMSVRALAYLIPGHAAHHLEVMRERYL